MTIATVYTEVEVDVDLADISTDDLIEELESRGETLNDTNNEQLIEIWQLRRQGLPFDRELDNYIYTTLGKVI